MNTYVRQSLWFLLGLGVFLGVEGFFYLGPQMVQASVAGVSGFAFFGDAVLIIWSLIVGVRYARNSRYNAPFVMGAVVGSMIVSMSFKPVMIVGVIFLLTYLVFSGRREGSESK